MPAGQAQKEFFVNQALTILDSLQSGTVIASQAAPPSDPVDGESYRVTAPAADAWEGCEDHLALRIAGDWHFIPPREGLRVFDSAADRSLFFREGWQSATAAVPPANGTVIDIEARAAIDQLISALRNAGILMAESG